MKDINLFKMKDSYYFKKINSKDQISNEDICEGYLIDGSEKEARRIIDFLKGKNKIIAFVGGDDSLNRRAIEKLKINYLISPEKNCFKDTLKQRDSGLNHVVAKEAEKRNISIVVDISELSKLSPKLKSFRISKIIQNVKICRKAGCKIKLASLALNKESVIDEINRRSLGVVFGMSSEQSRDSVFF